METITVHTTQNIDIDYEVGGLGERILAYLIDAGFFAALMIIGGIALSSVLGQSVKYFFIAIGLLLLFYDLLCETFFNGQTAGKYVMKIKVISLDGNRAKFSQYLLRWLFRMVDFSLSWWVCGVLTIALTDKGQRVGDLVAGTAVVRTVPRTKRDKVVFNHFDDTYTVVFTQVSQLSDSDIGLIHEVIQTYLKTGNTQVVYHMADKIRRHLQISLPPEMNSMQFLQTILKDYSHVTAQADAL
ncbi:putative RDD family membrane protein YckC [Mucilaginibacter frigoritolerans]|uniref:Putative RDD family membrane protein YckC n=1 Tax=Mucilaginibacter frigoritolerans TaxID=652788 RepID=A0A562U2U7_9SPHI|nr:RDD family protein [Mucilaginibacter frigoritolerans]TWI99828.1 putative RDD family membrane protein YckC [Mucilaginibacter frigoritolerans]